MKKNKVLSGVFLFLFIPVLCQAAVPQPKSEGKYFSGKGTRASEGYESTAGMPVYDYGKGIQWGPVHFRPSLDYRFRWEDNVFLEESGEEKNDLINSIYGDLSAELPLGGGQHLVTAGGSFVREIFGSFDSQNHTNYMIHGGAKLNYVPFTLDFDDIYEQTESRSNTEFTQRVKRDENAFHSLLEVPFSQFFLENEITNFTSDYSLAANEVFSHNLFTVYQRLGHDISPNTQVLAELTYINIDYSHVGDRNGEGFQYTGGLRGNLSEFIAYQAWIGAQHRSYDSDVRPDFNNLVFRAALQYEPSSLSTWVLKWVRLPQESTYDGQSFYTHNQADLSWKRQIRDRVYWNTQGSIGYNEYSRITVRAATSEAETRRDWLWNAGTGLEYKMPNDIVSLTLDYRYVNRESNMDGLDYEGNEVSVGAKALF